MASDFGTVPPAAPRSSKTNTLAIVSLVCGVLSIPLICCWPIGLPLGIVAVVLGVIARNQIGRTGEQGGGLAIAGIALGAIMVVLTGILLAVGATVDVQKWQQQLQRQQGIQVPGDEMIIKEQESDLGDAADAPVDEETTEEETVTE